MIINFTLEARGKTYDSWWKQVAATIMDVTLIGVALVAFITEHTEWLHDKDAVFASWYI